MPSLSNLFTSILSLLPSQRPFLSSPPHPRLGAVSSESTLCSRIGATTLQNGGNAADATIATVFCVGVVGMYRAGIGGGGFALIRKPDDWEGDEGEERYEFVDFRETAPGAAAEEMYQGNAHGSRVGGLASGVPGEVRGLQYIHENYGSLPWADLIKPSIELARKGWRVNEDLVRYMASAMSGNSTDFLIEDPEWAKDFAPNGQLLTLGEIITRKRYAATLEVIANEGPDAFYEGPIAESMIVALQKSNGTMTMEDLRNYTVAIRDITKIEYRGYRVYSIDAPGGGPVALSTLKTLSQYRPVDKIGINLTTHRLDEAMKFAYGMRTELGDPLYLGGMDEYVRNMTSDKLAKELRAKISDRHVLDSSVYDPKGLEILETPGTAHISVADASGMAISLTSTVNLLFGSQLVVPETGIIMNDEMDDFSIPNVTNAFGYVPSPANFIRPGKRPLSSMSPAIVEFANGTLYFVVGAAGGSRITSSTIQAMWHVLDRNMTATEALAQPRFHDQLIPRQITFETSYDNSTVEFLRDRGHNITFISSAMSAAQAVMRRNDGTFEAASEPRQKNSGGNAV